MTKTFKKNDTVTIIQKWNNLGDYYTREAIVRGCGAKQMTLICASTGENLGNNFQPTIEQRSKFFVVVPAGTDVVAEATARMEAHAAFEIAHFERCLANVGAGEGYVRAITKSFDAFKAHTRTVATYEERIAAMRAAKK